MPLPGFNNANKTLKFLKVTFLLLLMSSSLLLYSQEKKRVEILNSGYGESVSNMGTEVQRLVDSVFIRHKDILMWCDTAYLYNGTNKVDAVGNVHIEQGDTLNLYANNVFYDGDSSFARAWDHVILINKETKLYSDTVDYDLERNIVYYDDYGKIVDTTNTLTSVIGKYFVDDNNVFFYHNVVATNDKFTLNSDTVKYNTETGIMYIKGPTTIRDSANTLYAEDGWYNSKTGETELKKHVNIYNSTQRLRANYVKYNKVTGNGRAFGSVTAEDLENRSIVKGNIAIFNKIEDKIMVTDSAIYMTYSKADTLYLHADTLRTVPDTVEGEKIVSAYFGVRFYRTDIQGICDSMVYFTKDSIIQLYNAPVIWSQNHQLSADKIEVIQNADAPDELHLTKNSFIISEQDTGQFDQIKGKEMIGYIVNQKLKRIDVNGNGQTLYYAREKEDIIGLNKAESSKISIYFKDGKINKINFIKTPSGEIKPLSVLKEGDKTLKDFDWKIRKRPMSKNDIFPRADIELLEK